MKIWTHRNEPPQRQCGNAIPSINKMAYHFILDMTVTVQIYLTYHFGKWKRILQIHCTNGSPLYTTTFWKQLSLFCIQDYGGGNSIFWWEKEWERTLAIQAGDKELSGVALCLSKGCFKSYSKMLLKQNNHSTICTHAHTHKRVCKWQQHWQFSPAMLIRKLNWTSSHSDTALTEQC